jgi:hypothetical protein
MIERPHVILVHEYPTTHMQTKQPFHLSMVTENSREDEHPEVRRLHVLMRATDTDSKASSVAYVLISRRFGFDAHVAFQRFV